jgi:hypothetical protein
MASRKKQRMKINSIHSVAVMDLGAIEIWDGADLALLRETLYRLVDVEKHRAIGVNMTYVKYVPSGFFGMLYDCHERGINIFLYSPQPNVANMLWFRQFFDRTEDGSFRLHSEPKLELLAEDNTDWTDERLWDELDQPSHFVMSDN